MKKKQIMAMLLVVVLLTMNVFYADVLFTDISGHWGESIIIEAAEKGIIKGRGDNKFDPDGVVTAAEFTVMCVRALNQNVTLDDEDTFSDVTKNDWFYNEIEAAVQLGLVKKADRFIPNEPISRERMATIAFRAFGGDAEAAELNFTDADEIADWAKEPIAKSITIGLINGMGDGTFQPKAKLTRAQSAASGSRLYDKLDRTESDDTELNDEDLFPSETKPSASPSPSNSGGGGGGGGGGGYVPTVTPTPSVAPSNSPVVSSSASPSVTPSATPSESPSVMPSESPSISPSTTPSAAPSTIPSIAPSTEPSSTPSVPPMSGNTTTFTLDDDWSLGLFNGPIVDGSEVLSYYTVNPGATAIYDPEFDITKKRYVAVYIYVINEGHDSDTDAKYQIYHNGRVDEIRINTSTVPTGYYFAGVYDFVGRGNEYVKAVRTTNGTAKMTISAVRFDILKQKTGVNNPVYNQNSEVESSIFVVPTK